MMQLGPTANLGPPPPLVVHDSQFLPVVVPRALKGCLSPQSLLQ